MIPPLVPVPPSAPGGSTPPPEPKSATSSPFGILLGEEIRFATSQSNAAPVVDSRFPLPAGHPSGRGMRQPPRSGRAPNGSARKHREGPVSQAPASLAPPSGWVPPAPTPAGGSHRVGTSAPRSGVEGAPPEAGGPPARSQPPPAATDWAAPVTGSPPAAMGKVPPQTTAPLPAVLDAPVPRAAPPPPAAAVRGGTGVGDRPSARAGAFGPAGTSGPPVVRLPTTPAGPAGGMASAASGRRHPTGTSADAANGQGLPGPGAWQASGPVSPGLAPASGARPAAGGSLRGHLLAQVGRGLVRAASTGTGRVRLVLNPPTLGRVTLVVARRGQSVRAILHVENPVVQDLLRSGLSDLQGLMAQQGSPPLLAQVLVSGAPPGSGGFAGDGKGEGEPRGRYRRVRLSSRVSRGGWRPLLASVREGVQKGGVSS